MAEMLVARLKPYSNIQHVAFIIGLGGLVPCPSIVDACLAASSGEQPRVLDLGCGTGIWASQMAQRYPHASVLGLDLAAPSPSANSSLPNLEFKIHDVNKGLATFYDSFNVVHARLISTGVNDYRLMMEEAERCLRPGGVVIFWDYDAMFCNENQVHRQAVAGSTDGEEGKVSWLSRCAYELRSGAPLRGSDILGMEKSLDEGLWGHELLDPETAQAASLFLPMGPWATGPDDKMTKKLQVIGSLIREDYGSAFRAVIGAFPRFGVPQNVIEEWRPKVEAELKSSALHMWTRSRLAWARRRAAPNEAAPRLPIPDSTPYGITPDPDTLLDQYSGYPTNGTTTDPTQNTKKLEKVGWLHLYKTAEECVNAAKVRNESLGTLPVPWVLRKGES
ncbi:hypothetical protein M408DRAFT_329454 [Serendipita vermifera MAFF 305830]|uniref:Methyltransferase domain-containing protein n=1 Tax=Serendipita vermifera MAFF 305830 TaxID=933852 RepID=A0A0C3B887_SERVB|nr:hypothetical protein M408DRAFT_329454 [Serendipita vermifera MAFF 305830]